jgi:anti-anti-sigma factor
VNHQTEQDSNLASQSINVTVEQDTATVSLSGEHEAYTADKLAKNLCGLLAEGVPVTIDLRHTEFIDSTVVGVLLAAQRRADDAELGFRLVLGPETGWPVRRMLEVTGLLSSFDVVQ